MGLAQIFKLSSKLFLTYTHFLVHKTYAMSREAILLCCWTTAYWQLSLHKAGNVSDLHFSSVAIIHQYLQLQFLSWDSIACVRFATMHAGVHGKSNVKTPRKLLVVPFKSGPFLCSEIQTHLKGSAPLLTHECSLLLCVLSEEETGKVYRTCCHQTSNSDNSKRRNGWMFSKAAETKLQDFAHKMYTRPVKLTWNFQRCNRCFY